MANRIFILEPQWNPSVEVQAIARARRMSQLRQVFVTRYIVRNTVEEVRISTARPFDLTDTDSGRIS